MPKIRDTDHRPTMGRMLSVLDLNNRTPMGRMLSELEASLLPQVVTREHPTVTQTDIEGILPKLLQKMGNTGEQLQY